MNNENFKLVELKCKNCGAMLKSLDNAREIECNYCHSIFKVDFNYEKIGYDFENGRIKAQLDNYEVDLSDTDMPNEFDVELSGWKAQAIRAAKSWLECDPYSKKDLK